MSSIIDAFLTLFNGINPKNYNDFYDNVDKESIMKKYSLLTYLNNKYNFLDDPEVCIEWEFNLFNSSSMYMPDHLVNKKKFNKYLDIFNSHNLHHHRTQLTIEYICKIFTECLLGECRNYNKYMPLCLFFGKKSLNKNMRRQIYDNLDHNAICNTINKIIVICPPYQLSILKLYCRFLILSGKVPNPKLLKIIDTYKFKELPLSKDLTNQVYNANRIDNKSIRHINSINIDVGDTVKLCNFIDVETKPKFRILNGLLCKIIGDDVDYVMSLRELSTDTQLEIVDKLTDKYETVVIHTYLHQDKIVIDIDGVPYLTKEWDNENKKYIVTVA